MKKKNDIYNQGNSLRQNVDIFPTLYLLLNNVILMFLFFVKYI